MVGKSEKETFPILGASEGTSNGVRGTDPRTLSKQLQLSISLFSNTMAFSITPYFSSDARHSLHVRETLIGIIFASFPIGYMIVSAGMSFANIAHLRLRTVCGWVRVMTVVFTVMSVLFAATPSMYNPIELHCANCTVSAKRFEEIGTTYAYLFSTFRLLQGMSVAVLDVLVLLYLTKLFPEKVSQVVGEREAIQGLGVVIGPPFGGLLFKAAGFLAPPVVTGATVLLVAIGTHVVIRRSAALRALHEFDFVPHEYCQHAAKIDKHQDGHAAPPLAPDATHSLSTIREEDENEDEASVACGEDVEFVNEDQPIPRVTMEHFVAFMRLPFCLSMGPVLSTSLSIACFAFLESMAPLYVYNEYGIEAWAIGLVMGGSAVVYAVIAIILGHWLGQRGFVRPYLLSVWSVVLAVGMFLVAPSFSVVMPPGRHPLHIAGGEALSVIGMLVVAAAMAGNAVGGVSLVVDSAKNRDKRIVPAAGAIVSCGMSFGGFVGPVVGSALAEAFGFPIAFFAFACAAIVVGAVYTVSYSLPAGL